MSLAAPWFLLALAIVPMAVAAQRLSARRRNRFAVRFPAAVTLAGVIAAPSAWRRRLPAVLLAAAVATLAVALARPQKTVAVAAREASIVLVIDTSRSMEAQDVEPDRLAAARKAAQRFVGKVPKQINVGVVAFSDVIHTVQAPVRDRDTIRATIDALQPIGGTNTGGALEAALSTLTRKKRQERPPSAIVLLSDGKATDGPDPVTVAGRARRERIPISTVALGTPDGVVEGGPYGGFLPVPPDPETMRAIARASGGQAFTAENSDQLGKVYERLGSRIGSRSEKREITAAFAAGGLLFLLAGTGLAARWRGTF
jgi:Ca-activated chloride channel family protein